MSVVISTLRKESQDRYLTYALSIVSGRALPDVRDGLKPVQRRILYTMLHNLNLRPEGSYKKSATVVGEVLGKFHPHGDVPCYEAMVRMAQDFSLRYPLVDGQGNFGSLDGDSAAAYRYTEAKLRHLAIEVIGEIHEETVEFRDNFDGTVVEPVVLPSRVPNLLINGASGIAVGMATSIPPHNLKETVRALIELSKDPEITIARITSFLKAPDFPTGCLILNTKKELDEIYRTGRGSIRMRGEWKLEDFPRGKQGIIVTSIPYALNKATLIEKIADLIMERKVPQLLDVRDESTDEVRIVLELANGANPEAAMAYLFKNTPLESTFPMNLTVVAPTGPGGAMRPELLSLKQCLQHFLDFREEVVVKRLEFEKKKHLERIHILEGLVKIFDALDKAIAIVRKSDGRSDAATKLREAFKLTEIQSFAIVDMRIYQLSRTNIEEIRKELKERLARVKEIDRILSKRSSVQEIVREELEAIGEKYGDRRRSSLVKDLVETEFKAEDYVVQEDVHAIVTRDGWIKRIRQSNDVSGTRLREGDAIAHAHAISTLDTVVFLTSHGSLYTLKVTDFPASSGFGEPVQKLLRFKDEEKVVDSFAVLASGREVEEKLTVPPLVEKERLLLVSQRGMGSYIKIEDMSSVKRSGRRIMKVRDGDALASVGRGSGQIALFTRRGYALVIPEADVPERDGASIGVILMKVGSDDAIIASIFKPKTGQVLLTMASGRTKEVEWKEITAGHRGLKGTKIISQGEIVSISTKRMN